MVRKETERRVRFWVLLAGLAVGIWVTYLAAQGPRSPQLERILQENCPGWVC
jgi:hypothetical protein